MAGKLHVYHILLFLGPLVHHLPKISYCRISSNSHHGENLFQGIVWYGDNLRAARY